MTETSIQDYYVFGETSSKDHWHTPSTGGEICWNNRQWAIRMNALIKEYNKGVDDGLTSLDGEEDHIPYIAIPDHPTMAFNTHHHTSEYDGGLIFGGGIHDHRSMQDGGFAYSVYHPGHNLPNRAYEREEVFS